jgi:hypothetical protein
MSAFRREPCNVTQFAKLVMNELNVVSEFTSQTSGRRYFMRPRALSRQRERGLRLLAHWWLRGIERQILKRANDHDLFEENVT